MMSNRSWFSFNASAAEQSSGFEPAPHKGSVIGPNLIPVDIDYDKEDAYVLLAKELNTLSVAERDSIFADIHGVQEIPEEAPELIASGLLELEKEIKAIKHKATYLIAEKQSRDYVHSSQLRLRFLRAHRYNIKGAASAFVRFFDVKLELFGADSLGRGITLAKDFDDEDMNLIRSGVYQILPGTDNSGRTIVSSWPSVLHENSSNMKSMMKVLFYGLWVASETEQSQRRGLVCISYSVGVNAGWDRRPQFRQASYIMSVMPMRMNSMHYCYDNGFLRPLINFGMLIVGKDIRARVRLHYGSPSQVLFKLSTFGISQDILPIYDGGTRINLDNHHKWIDERLEYERKWASEEMSELVKETVSVGSSGVVPTQYDILFGRGKSFQNHSGNVWLRGVVDNNLERYDAASKREKTAIANEILESVYEKRGRFLKRDSDVWQEVDDSTARYKISHMFRGRRQRPGDASDDTEESQDGRLSSQHAETTNRGNKRLRTADDVSSDESFNFAVV